MPSKNTKKKMKKIAQQAPKKAEVEEVVEVQETEQKQEPVVEQAPAKETEQQTKEKEPKKAKAKQKKEKRGGLKAKTREVASELKKVTWPTFPQVVKKTATVLAVVVVFAVVLLGIDSLLEVIYNWFIGGLK